MPILLLGGTGEARTLAARLHPGTDIISSLAGRVPDPALPAGPVRIGGLAVSQDCDNGCATTTSPRSSTPPIRSPPR